MRTKIENFLERFPKEAVCWSQATDEIRDLARWSREYLEEFENVIVEPLDFRTYKRPSEWNTKGREYILANFDRMNDQTKKRFYERFEEWFYTEEEQPDPAQAKRNEIVTRIYSLYNKLQSTDFGVFLIPGAKLKKHLAGMNDQTLMAALRFYESLAENDNQ
ncbi:hypothetical protein KML24007_03940 [Alistipes indistinctus]|uniref:hypothetical protein n=1 Tax=Alistipes indistinctus TaxID=626932 RepID=UPI0036F2BFE3